MSSTLVILNPAAHSERAQRKRAQVESLAQDCVVYTTTRTGEAELMARRGAKEGFEKIVAAGGDGVPGEAIRVEHCPGGDLLRANPRQGQAPGAAA